jgi:ribose-phosphate pyrophosphokinase
MKILCQVSDWIELDFKKSKFPGGEIHLKIEDAYLVFGRLAHITTHIKCSDDIISLLLATDVLKRAGAKSIGLNLIYLPYARQDKVFEKGEALSLRVMCDIINSQRYSHVIVNNVHSDVALALIDNVHHAVDFPEIAEPDSTVIVSPDAGSLKKVMKFAKENNLDFVRADKSRPSSGSEWECTVYSDHIGDKNFLIIDDICDGGRTFIELGKKLKLLTNGRVDLFITHGIFSNGFDCFKGSVDRIYCELPWVSEDTFKDGNFLDVNSLEPK